MNESSYPEEEYVDLVDLVTTETTTVRVQSDLLRAEFSTWRVPELQTGITVTQDGSDIGLSAGTVNDDEIPHMYVWSHLTPEQAEKIADALIEAASRARAAGTTDSDAAKRTFVRRLRERLW